MVLRHKLRNTTIATLSCLIVNFSFPALAGNSKLLGKFDDWKTYLYSDKAGKVCYAVSLPKPNPKGSTRRGDAHLSVTDRTADHSIWVVTVSGGYTYKKETPAQIDVEGAKFGFYTAGDRAWTTDDKAVVRAMLKGRAIFAYGTSTKGWRSTDIYSLKGFPQALAEIDRACGRWGQ